VLLIEKGMEKETSTKSSVDRLISTIGDLPASPATVSAVMGLTSNLDAKVADVSRLLSSDQSLTARVLKLSNSSYYGRSKEVTTLREAIMVLGFFTVRSMVIASSAHTMFQKGQADQISKALWEHSFSTAVAARQIAAHIKHPNKDEIFIAALMHDIGKLVLLQKFPDAYAQLIEQAIDEQIRIYDIEAREYSFTHCDVASLLLEKWSFPDNLCAAIQMHHDPPPISEDQVAPPSQVILLANYMAKGLGIGFADWRPDNFADTEAARALGLDESTIDNLMTSIENHYQAEIKIFEE